MSADIISRCISKNKNKLHQELKDLADDPVLFKRRFRMIRQLSRYETDIYQKIYEFSSSDPEDYFLGIINSLTEISDVINRSG